MLFRSKCPIKSDVNVTVTQGTTQTTPPILGGGGGFGGGGGLGLGEEPQAPIGEEAPSYSGLWWLLIGGAVLYYLVKKKN